MAFRCLKVTPRWHWMASRETQESPNTAPRAPNSAPRAPQDVMFGAPEGRGEFRTHPLLIPIQD
eukprot:8125469-Pyramimonas_sp.AAC.1